MLALAAPLLSMDPVDWAVYSDWLEDNPGQKITADKARRIAFILEHWERAGGDKRWHETVPPAYVDTRWLELHKPARSMPWQWRFSVYDPRHHKTMTGYTPVPRICTWEQRLTNPAQEPLCGVYQWVAWKFYATILDRRTTRAILSRKNWDTFRRTFLGYGVARDLQHWVDAGVKQVRRVGWVRGEYVEIVKRTPYQPKMYQSECLFVRPGVFEPIPFKSYRTHDHDWAWTTTAIGNPVNRTIRPKAEDWIPV